MRWRTAPALGAQVLQRLLDIKAALEVTRSGAAACGVLWLADVPSELLAIGGLYPAIGAVKARAL